MPDAFRIDGPYFQAFDPSTGDPLAGGKVYTYETGTTTNKTTYTTEAASVANANPVILDSAGKAAIHLDGIYKIVLYDSDDVLVWTADPVTGATTLAQEWINQATATYVNATTFTLVGDWTSLYTPFRQVKLSDASTLYDVIVSSSFGGGVTTITISTAQLTGSLSSSLARVVSDLSMAEYGLADLPSMTRGPLRYISYYSTPGDGGHGWFRWDSSNLSTEVTADPRHGIYVPPSSDTSGASGAWVRQYTGRAQAAWFGVVGDNATDNYAALQDCIDLFCPAGDGPGFDLPDGVVRISDTVTITGGYGWVIRGVGRRKTQLICTTDNRPVIKVAGTQTHSWRISEMVVGYLNTQTVSDTGSIAICNDSDVCFNHTIDRVDFPNGYYCVGNEVGRATTTWGSSVRECTANTAVSGGFAYFKPSPSAGQPNVRFEHIYIRADNMAGPIFDVQAFDSCNFASIEVNVADQGPQIIQCSSAISISIDGFKLENGTYDSAFNGKGLFDFGNAQVEIAQMTILFGAISDITLGAGNSMYFFTASGSTKHKINIGTLIYSVLPAAFTSGSIYVSNVTGANNKYMAIGAIDDYNSYGGVSLTNVVSTGAADHMHVAEWAAPRVSADAGDADKTVSVGDETIIQYNTTLTADRTVTLPAENTNPSNCFSGLTYRIVRSAATPGAFTLFVKNDGAGTLDSLGSGVRGAITVAYRRPSWVVIGHEEW